MKLNLPKKNTHTENLSVRVSPETKKNFTEILLFYSQQILK